DASVAAAIAGAGTVVNLVGIGFERGRQRFAAVHVEGARRIAAAAHAAGVARLVQTSALGADGRAASRWARSRAEGEAAARAMSAEAIVMRPSLVFGPDDGFFNLMASLARLVPVFP